MRQRAFMRSSALGMTGRIMLAASEALGVGVIVSAFLFGFRHGIDWDHIAAITDITSSQEERGLALEYGTIYALGHALVVFLIGVAAIVLGAKLPDGVDEVMERVVGITLIVLGVAVRPGDRTAGLPVGGSDATEDQHPAAPHPELTPVLDQ